MIAGWLLLSASLASPPCSTCTNTSTHLQSSITTSHCSTILQHPSNPQLAGDEDHTHPTPSQPPSAGEKGVRNPLGGTPNEYLTDNFAIKWGVTDGFSVEDVHALGDAFEESWRRQVEEMTYPQPEGTTTWRLNIYIGNTQGNTPSINPSASGYFTLDDEDQPMIVLSPSHVGAPDKARLTAAHEFFHAIQWTATPDYGFTADHPAAWYMEATASWIEVEVFADGQAYADPLYGFAFLPELALNAFDYPDTGSVSEAHHYGAFLFVRYLAEHQDGLDLIRRSFLETQGESDPLQVLQRLLTEDDKSLETIFQDFAARNTTFDYAHRDWYLAAINSYGGWDSIASHRPTGRLSPYSSDWRSPTEHLPYLFGANYWELKEMPTDFSIVFEGALGPRWYAAVQTTDGVDHTRWEMVNSSASVGEISVSGFNEAEGWLVVTPTLATTHMDLTFDYQVRVVIDGDLPAETGDSGGSGPPKSCACGPAPLKTSWLGLLMGLGWTLTRRTRFNASRPRSSPPGTRIL